jgi:hypothetical protein
MVFVLIKSKYLVKYQSAKNTIQYYHHIQHKKEFESMYLLYFVILQKAKLIFSIFENISLFIFIQTFPFETIDYSFSIIILI